MMSCITDELRESMIPCISDGWLTITKSAFERVADRIDKAYKSALTSAYRNGVESVTLPDMTAYVKLPVDANGVPIRVGDVIAYEDNTKPKEVVALVPPSVVMVDSGPRFADSCRHYKTPTVEDVLREIVHKCQPTYSKDGSYTTGLTKEEFAEYAAKLRAIIEGSKGPEWQETDSQDEGR